MTSGSLLFAVCTLLSVAGAFIVILEKNPIRGALGLLTTIVGIAGLFLRLNAEFLAAMQILVYAGAVVILFVFVIMLLGPAAGDVSKVPARAQISRALGGGLMGLIGLVALSAVAGMTDQVFTTIGPDHGSVAAVGTSIYRDGLVPFELATALLLVAVIGAIAVARSKPSALKPARIENPTLRLFHGPLTERDAQGPVPDEPLHVRAADENQPGSPAADNSPTADKEDA